MTSDEGRIGRGKGTWDDFGADTTFCILMYRSNMCQPLCGPPLGHLTIIAMLYITQTS